MKVDALPDELCSIGDLLRYNVDVIKNLEMEFNRMKKRLTDFLGKIEKSQQDSALTNSDSSSFDCYPLSETEKEVEQEEIPTDYEVIDVSDFETRKRLIMRHLSEISNK